MKAEESFGANGYTYLGNGNFVGNGGGVAPSGQSYLSYLLSWSI